MISRALWRRGQPWVDFRPLLEGEAIGAVSFVSVNRSLYVVNAAEGWFRRSAGDKSNPFRSDGSRRDILELVTATPCGLRMRWGSGDREFISTTEIDAVFAGELDAGPDDVIATDSVGSAAAGHPAMPCGAMNCEVRIVVVVLADEVARD